MKGLRFGFLGSGQGGNNVANEMAAEGGGHIYAITNIAGVDMSECINIPEEYRFKIGDKDGAGQNIKVGRQEVIKYKEQIKQWVRNVFSECDMTYLIGSAGGGFSTIATPTISAIMAEELQMPHSIIYILPRHNEDLIRQKNAKAGLIYLKDLAEKSRNLKNYMIIENEKLIELAKNLPGKGSLWQKANQEISNRLQCAYKYTLRPSTTAIDPADYKKVIFRRGGSTVIETAVSITESTTEKVLALKFREILQQDLSQDFITAGDLSKAEAIAVFLERETPFEKEGEAVEILKEVIRDETTAILRPVGVYRPHDEEEKKSFLQSARSLFRKENQEGKGILKMTVVFAGMPFPSKVIDDFEERIQKEERLLLEAKNSVSSKKYTINKEEIDFLDEVNLVAGVKETHSLLNSDVLGNAFDDYADDEELEELKDFARVIDQRKIV